MLFVLGIGLYTSRLVLEALGVDDYGLYSIVGGVVALFTVINMALIAGSSRFITFELGRGNKETLKKTFSASFGIHTLIAVIIFILAETVGLWYVNTIMVVPPGRLAAANWVYQFSIFSTVFSLTQVPYNAIIVAYERMKIYAWISIAESLFKLLLVLLLLYVNFMDRLIGYGLFWGLWSVLLMIFLRFYCVRNFPESRLTLVKEKVYYKRMLSFSLWDLIGCFCYTGNGQGVNLLINYFFGVAFNAARGVAGQVELGITQLTSNFMTAVKPQIVKLYAVGQIDKMLALVYQSSKYSYFLLYIIALPVFFEADYIMSIWLKTVPEHAALFLRWIIAGGLIRTFAGPVIQAVHATGNIKWLNLYAGGVSVLLTIPATYILFRNGYPAVTTFYVAGIVGFLANCFELYALKKEVAFSIRQYFIQTYGICFLITLFSVFPVYYVHHVLEPSIYRLLLVCVVDVLVVGLLIFFVGMTKAERHRLITLIKIRIKPYVKR